MPRRIPYLGLFVWALAVAATLGGWLPVPHAAAAQTAVAAAAGSASRRTLRLPETPYRYAGIDLPAHFTKPVAQRFDNTPSDNPVTDHGATLGRVLFYDTRLSVNDTISCGSCHVQKHAFVDPNRFSRGFAGGLTDRHAMSLVNLRYVPRARFFWDERAGNLEQMVLMPIANPVEMGRELSTLPAALARDDRYAQLFRLAFGDAAVTVDRVGRALAQFLRSMVSYQSRYDAGLALVRSADDDFANFTRTENRGKALFLRNCSVCHLPLQQAHFVLLSPANTGLDDNARDADGGVGDITLNPRELGHFKSPSLRNVEFTKPYMHDGRFSTLEAVIDHYSSGGRDHPNKDGRMLPMNFTESEKEALVAFLKTLTDTTFLTDPKFSDPFE
jgi:cytochrome c peroxidase